MEISRLPDVGRILGLQSSGGSDLRKGRISLQYEDVQGRLQLIEMSLGEALYLLSLLKATQLNLGIPFPDDPRAPSAPPA